MSKINVLAELDRYGLPYHFADGDEVKCICPFHSDTSPSCFVNLEKAIFICRAAQCGAKGDVIDLLARHMKVARKLIMTEFGKRYVLNDEPTVRPTVVERYHSAIWLAEAETLRNELYKRGLTDEDIRKYRLGFKDGRITIPIANLSGHYVNVRSYLPGAAGTDKMRNLKGRSKIPRLFPYAQLSYNRIVVTGGEIKAIAGATRLNPHGIGCITAIGGEGTWHPSFTEQLIGKQIFVLMDIDEGGRVASEKICRLLCKVATTIHDIVLDLDPAKHPKGDLNDYVMERPVEDLLALLEKSQPWTPPKDKPEFGLEDPEDVTLNDAYHADFTGKRVHLTALISAVDTKSCAIAKRVKVKCDRAQEVCAACRIFANPDDEIYEINPESDTILKMAYQPDFKQQFALKEELEIPNDCRACTFKIVKHHNVESVLLSGSLSITDERKEKELLPALIVGQDLELNEQYEFVGTPHPHPRDQTTTLVISKYKASLDALSTYQITKQDKLKLFRPIKWTLEDLKAKWNDICNDFEANVTRIRFRPEIHILTDLAYHSPLILNMGEAGMQRGWVQVLILGDSAQGKSEVASKLMGHYGLGERVVCKNATRSGLLGGIDQSTGGNFVTWGAIPTHDRRLVVLEEFKGVPVDVIATLTDMRDSGRAELQKIKKRRTNARTRLIAISNSRSGNQMAQYPYGVTAVMELIGAAEDVRRFDAAIIVAKEQIDQNSLNNRAPEYPHRYTKELCRELVLWAWTRHSRVQFHPLAIQAIMTSTSSLSDQFTDEIPLVDRGSMRFKLARLAAACAARTFSTSDDYEEVLVRECHVQFIVEFLREQYSSFAFGYDRYTNNRTKGNLLRDPEQIKKKLEENGDNAYILEMLIEQDRIRLNDIIDASGNNDIGWARQFVSFLVQRRALINKGAYYVKSAEFVKFLTETKFKEAPKFIDHEF